MKLQQLPATPAVRTVTRRSFSRWAFAGAALLRRVLSPVVATGEMLVAGTITCPGRYSGHLQGVCANDAGGIFWSFTTTLVRTTERGVLQAQVPVPAHHGAPCVVGNRLYVAVNLTVFNDPKQRADSWVYVYDAETLQLLSRFPVPDVIFGAGGIVPLGPDFLVFGGAPLGSPEARLYRYDRQFRLQSAFGLPTQHTRKGIQTAAFFAGHWWFGCYGDPEPIALKTSVEFDHVEQFAFDCSLGIVILHGRALVARGSIVCDPAATCTGMLIPAKVSAGVLSCSLG